MVGRAINILAEMRAGVDRAMDRMAYGAPRPRVHMLRRPLLVLAEALLVVAILAGLLWAFGDRPARPCTNTINHTRC